MGRVPTVQWRVDTGKAVHLWLPRVYENKVTSYHFDTNTTRWQHSSQTQVVVYCRIPKVSMGITIQRVAGNKDVNHEGLGNNHCKKQKVQWNEGDLWHFYLFFLVIIIVLKHSRLFLITSLICPWVKLLNLPSRNLYNISSEHPLAAHFFRYSLHRTVKSDTFWNERKLYII